LTRISEKLQLKEDASIRVLGAPTEIKLDVKQTGRKEEGTALLVFALSKVDLRERESAVVDSARADRLTWVAYPKAGQKGTDLNRDILVRHFEAKGIQGVRMISIDDVWSALRFRPMPGRGQT
jgi:hypothetical protein